MIRPRHLACRPPGKPPAAGAWVFLPLLLSGCCPFGYQSTSVREWAGDMPGTREEVQAACQTQERIAVHQRTSRFIDMVVEECAKEKPFASIGFANPSTGQRYDMAAAYTDALCPGVRANGKVSADLLGRYCRECSTTSFDLERCYKDNGLKRVERSSFACKSMPLF